MIRILFVLSAALIFVGCTLTEWGQIAKDTAETAPQVVADPATWSSGWLGIGGAVISIAAIVYRKSLARNFGRAVTAVKGLVK